MFHWFEKRVNPYPDAHPKQPPAGFMAFLWAGTRGMRGLILALIVLTAAIGAFEALLFSMLGSVVDWLADVPPQQLWAREGDKLLLLAGILLASPVLIALQALCKYQGLFANFPMRLRWHYHRHLLGQSMGFYQDEFAGRVSPPRSCRQHWPCATTVVIVCDILVFVGHLLHHHGGRGRRLRPDPAAALHGLAAGLRADAVVLCPPPGQGGQCHRPMPAA